MKFKITHSTEYNFAAPVFLEPHYLRFRPSQTAFMRLEHFELLIDEPVAGHKVMRDEENNTVDFFWFNGMTEKLTITATSTLETSDFNPFEFLIHPQEFNTFPFIYEDLQRPLLSASLATSPISQELKTYSAVVEKTSEQQTIPFLTQLTNQIHKDFSVVYREEGAPFTPKETFNQKSGSCRDLSWMLIHLLRSLGIAARFVSGYYYFEMEEPSYELHAWVAAFIPGIGWLGLDPSHGILTGNTHFPIAMSAHYEQTMPVSGGLRGSATSQLKTSLQIDRF